MRRKFVAVFLLIIMVQSLFQPIVTYALTTGPHQPEYTSYEEPGATDMVNLLTGDFTFSLPILEVPGPDGSFSVPLTYNAGIGPEQEASWVGLGWTLNVGAITREINQYPDDASGEIQSVGMVDSGVRGWTSAALGLGQMGWDTQRGHYGSLSLLGIINATYDKSGLSTAGLVGVNVGHGVGFNPSQFMNAAMTIASSGAFAVEEGATSVTLSSIAKNAGENLLIGAALSAAFSSKTPTSPTGGVWTYNTKEKQGFLHKDFWIWLDQVRYEKMYGILNLQNAASVTPDTYVPFDYTINNSPAQPLPAYSQYSNGTGVASDINYYLPPSSTFISASSPATLATDNFTVKAPGITGSISPYRLDVGSISFPQSMTTTHLRALPVPYSAYKVPFVYDGSLSSSYLYHNGNLDGQPNNFEFNFGLNGSLSPARVYLNDNIFGSSRVRPDVTSNQLPQANHVEWMTNSDILSQSGGYSNGFMDYFSGAARTSFRQQLPFTYDRHYSSTGNNNFTSSSFLPMTLDECTSFAANQPLTLTATSYNSQSDMDSRANSLTTVTAQSQYLNTQINSGQPTGIQVQVPSGWSSNGNIAGKYLDIQIVATGVGSKSPTGIGGFSITGANGLTYHFALPVYDYNYYTYIESKANSGQNSTIQRSTPSANTWLLTGITGADFVDRGGASNGPNGIIDKNDWGYWVKFNYGNYANAYQWRTPYGSGTKSIAPDNSSYTYSQGNKQIYYLNSIETRSHAAIFIKDIRNDNMDATGSSSGNLKLSEIALLKRADYEALSTSYGMSDSGVITSNWLSSTLTVTTPAAGTFITQNALKRVKFTQTYDLCHSTPNSADVNKGKLTLTRLSLLGRNSAQTVPDYLFSYNNNPNYNSNGWDGWGMYNSTSTADYDNHYASDSDADASAWSLNKITTPLGSTIEVGYERDTYASVSGQYANLNTYGFATTATCSSGCSNGTPTLKGIANISDFHVGDHVLVNATVQGTCNGSAVSTSTAVEGHTIKSIAVTDANNNIGTITLVRNFGQSSTSCPNSLSLTYTGTVRLSNGRGGNLRVASILLNDQGRQYKTRYLYNFGDGSSSGVVAQEPGYVQTSGQSVASGQSSVVDFGGLPGYPMTPVMYANVTVLSGALSTDADYHTKEVYRFNTPHLRQVQFSSNATVPVSANDTEIVLIDNHVTDSTSRIGSLKSIQTLDNQGNVTSFSHFNYTDHIQNLNNTYNFQGAFSSGTIMHDYLTQQVGLATSKVFKMTRTSTIKLPSVLQTIVTKKDGLLQQTDNLSWDLYSGQVVEKNDLSALGTKTKTITKPAYTFSTYATMGPKALNNSTNKNMLMQSGAEYVYRLDANGNSTGLISASATTWKNDWSNYRELNAGSYGDASGASIWRKNKTYTYKGAYGDRQADGSVTFPTANGTEFDFAVATHPGWLQTGETSRYDHYSLPVESFNPVTGIYSSTKANFAGTSILATASNAKYFEFAYSGAEDLDVASGYFGGEVKAGAGTISTTAHTGSSSLSLSSGHGFAFRPTVANRKYRVSAWTNSTNGRIYYNNGGADVLSAAPVVSAVNSLTGTIWYQLNMEIPAGTAFSEVGVTTAGGTVLFDDFRFQPADAAVTANVYDAATGALTFVLDNQNMFTQYQYNDQGQLTKTYRESFAYGVKLISESKVNYKRFFVNP